MRLQNVLALTRATLLNEPFVSLFNNLVIEAKNVKRGDLFLAFDNSTIEQAVQNGAYGIVVDKEVPLSDTEIAWIKVNDLEDALKRLLRYIVLEKNVESYECDSVTFHTALKLFTDSTFTFLEGENKTLLKSILNLSQNAKVIFSPALVDKDIFTHSHLFKEPTQKITLYENTIFESSFIYRERLYEKVQYPALFLDKLELLLGVASEFNVEVKLQKLQLLKHFEPQFVNAKLQPREYGSTSRVLIFETEHLVIKQEIEFLEKEASWAKKLYILPLDLECKYENVYNYKTKKDIVKILEKSDFNFALIYGATKEEVLQSQTQEAQLSFEF